MQKTGVFYNTILLTISAILAKVLGAVYKIPLTNLIGPQGIGKYYLVFPVYSLLLVVSSSGISLALIRKIARLNKLGLYRQCKQYFRAAIILTIMVSGLLAMGVLLLSQMLANFHNDALLKYSYICIAPAIIISSVLAIIKAYYQGKQNMYPTAISVITEQVGKLVFGLLLAHILKPYGLQLAVCGAVLGITISQTISLLVVIIVGKLHKKRQQMTCILKDTKNYKSTYYKTKLVMRYAANNLWEMVADIGRNSILFTIYHLILPIMALVDSLIIVKMLVGNALSADIATTLYGLNTGVIATLVALPVMFTSALSAAIIPNLSQQSDITHNKNSVSNYIYATFVIAVLCAIVMFVLGGNIIGVLYGNSLNSDYIDISAYALRLIQLGAISIVYTSIFHTCSSVLLASNNGGKMCVIMSVAFLVRLFVMVVLIYALKLGIFGVGVADIVFSAMCATITLIKVKKTYNINYKLSQIMLPIVACATSGIVMGVLLNITSSTILNILISASTGLAVYVLTIIVGNKVMFGKFQFKWQV